MIHKLSHYPNTNITGQGLKVSTVSFIKGRKIKGSYLHMLVICKKKLIGLKCYGYTKSRDTKKYYEFW